MKKALVASILGIAVVTGVSAYGQGHTIMDNYDSTPYMNVTYSSNPANLPAAIQADAGQGVGDANYSVELLYALGASQPIGSLIPLPASIEAIDPSKTALGQPGYFDTLAVDVPGYVSGAVTFAVEAWYTGSAYAGGGATYALATLEGESATWNEASLSTGLSTGNTWAGLPGPNGGSLVAVAMPVPEPTTLALAGLGGAALLAFR